MRNQPPAVARIALRTSRKLDFCSEKELVAQTGHRKDDWPLVVFKELVDNALDACEEARAPAHEDDDGGGGGEKTAAPPPVIAVTVDARGITVADNGPGMPEATVAGVIDFDVRVSSREAYVAPDRGSQGNALKTVVAMPFVLDGERGRVEIFARGVHHDITLRVDRVRQEPVVELTPSQDPIVREGTILTVHWPDSASSILREAEARVLQMAEGYAWLNPHLTLTVDWFGRRWEAKATDPVWPKWRPSNPSSALWYRQDHFERNLCGYIAHEQEKAKAAADGGEPHVPMTVREFVNRFRGLNGSAKAKRVADRCGLSRKRLLDLAGPDGLDKDAAAALLAAMQAESKPVTPAALGVLGGAHLSQRMAAAGCDPATFAYRKRTGETDGVPWVIEVAFGAMASGLAAPTGDGDEPRRLVTGVNWSPGIVNPFRELTYVQGLGDILENQEAGGSQPIVFFIHMARPRVVYNDRGKSAVVVGRNEGPDAEVIIKAVYAATPTNGRSSGGWSGGRRPSGSGGLKRGTGRGASR